MLHEKDSSTDYDEDVDMQKELDNYLAVDSEEARDEDFGCEREEDFTDELSMAVIGGIFTHEWDPLCLKEITDSPEFAKSAEEFVEAVGFDSIFKKGLSKKLYLRKKTIR